MALLSSFLQQLIDFKLLPSEDAQRLVDNLRAAGQADRAELEQELPRWEQLSDDDREQILIVWDSLAAQEPESSSQTSASRESAEEEIEVIEAESVESAPSSVAPPEPINSDESFDEDSFDDDDDDDSGDPPDESYVSFGGEGGREDSEMDMTPMVDVTFLLLIFFMVTAAFSLQRSIEVPAPEETEASTQTKSLDELEDDPNYVIVRVDSYNTYQVVTADWEEEAPSKQDLLIKLRRARGGDSAGNVPTSLLVVANGEALHGKVVDAIDAGAAVGMVKVQLVTVEEDDE